MSNPATPSGRALAPLRQRIRGKTINDGDHNALRGQGGALVDDEEDTNYVQRSKAARQRSRKAMLQAVSKFRQAKERFGAAEDRMEYAAEAYRRTLLRGADLPPMPTVEVTMETVRLEGTADQDGQPEQIA